MGGFIFDSEAIRTASRPLYLTQASLEEYESQKIEEWGRDVEASSHVKLSLPLLTRDEETHYISVNFDPALVRLLRETKYFLLAELQVPESALAIYAQVETFRVWTQKLDMVVMKHNGPSPASLCTPLRRRRDSSPGMMDVGRFFSDFGFTQVPSRNCYR